MPYAPALRRVLEEAEDIAHATEQRLTSAHVLLAFFTSRNQAERLLRDRSIDEDRILNGVDAAKREPPETVREILERAAQITAGCGAREVDCLHVLVAMTRARDSLSYALLEGTGEKLGLLRTRSLTILTGAVPRWLTNREYAPQRRETADAQVSTRPSRTRAASSQMDRSRGRAPAIPWTPPLVMPASRAGAGAESRRRAAEHAARERAAETPKERAKDKRADRNVPRPEVILPPKKIAEPSLPAPVVREPELPVPSTVDAARAWLLPPESYPWLTSLGRNLSAEAARGELDRLIGREREVESLIDILGKRKANNPCLIGEPGVGKTAVVEGLAARLVKTPPTEKLGRCIVISLDVGALLVGTHLRGSFSEKLQGLKEEVKRSKGRVIVFFDELHTLVGAGSTGEGPQDAANELKAALARGQFPCIGATTYDEYVKHIQADPALDRRFSPVLIKEPSPAEATAMLELILPSYAEHHEVGYNKEAIDAAVTLSMRYITDRHLPDKAIALLDLAGSRAARSGMQMVDRELVAALVAERVDLPVERLLGSDRERLLGLADQLRREVIGHEAQLERVAEVVRRNAAGFSSRRPQGVFLFMGPTGVGKTETAKALAKLLHGSEDSMIRFDLSEFSEAHAVARLIGAPPGYVGHDAGGQLTEAVRRRPGRVVLFDEIEKAHRDVLQLLLQILDEGRLTDGHGRTVSFAETIIIMTSNLGADLAQMRKRIGFGGDSEGDATFESQVIERARERLAPELWGRIEERLVFGPLSRDEVKSIARLLAAESSSRLNRDRGITYDLDESALEFLLEQGGFDLSLGARPMRHVLSRIVEGPIAARILEGRLHANEHVLVSTRENGSLVFLLGDDRMSLSQRPPV